MNCTGQQAVGGKVGDEEGQHIVHLPAVLPVLLHPVAGRTHLRGRPLDLREAGVLAQSALGGDRAGDTESLTPCCSFWNGLENVVFCHRRQKIRGGSD